MGNKSLYARKALTMKKKIKKLLKKSYFWVEVVNMHYYFFNNREDYTQALRHFGLERDISGINGRCTSLENDGQTLILIGSFNNQDKDIVHECVHASLFTFDIIGQRLITDCEMLPYLTDTIYSKCKLIENIEKGLS